MSFGLIQKNNTPKTIACVIFFILSLTLQGERNSNYSFLYVTKSNEKACFSSFSWCSLSVSIQLL